MEETKYRLQNPKLSTTTKDIFKHYFGVYVYLPVRDFSGHVFKDGKSE